MATSMPPFFRMDSTHHGANVVVAAFTLMSYIIVVAVVRFYVGHGTENNALNDVAGEAIACVSDHVLTRTSGVSLADASSIATPNCELYCQLQSSGRWTRNSSGSP